MTTPKRQRRCRRRSASASTSGFRHRRPPPIAPGSTGLLRPRLLLHLEQRIGDLLDKPDKLYEPLKVYLMLGGDPNIPVDTALIDGWMQGDWQSLYPGEPNRAARDSLQRHLDAMLNLNDGVTQPIGLSGDLVKAAQTSLARLTLAERAFALIKSTAHDAEIKDWTVVDHAGPDAAEVFATNDGTPIESVGIPALFTYDGFYALFLDKMKAVISLLQEERWVLGEAGGSAALDTQFSNMGPDLFRLYDQEFTKTWSLALGRLKLNSFAAGKPDYATLRAATGASSPIKLLLKSIAAETKLTEAREQPRAATAPN